VTLPGECIMPKNLLNRYIGLFLCLQLCVFAQSSSQGKKQKETIMKHAVGTFDVKVIPQAGDTVGDPTIGRLALEKKFHGDLDAISKGQMLAVGNGAKGSSGGYVAIERVAGKLQGLSGTFAIQHSGTMTEGVAEMNVIVVPGSGTDQLAGISGRMTITIEQGNHRYTFEYSLPK